jgi:hypothetical protein
MRAPFVFLALAVAMATAQAQEIKIVIGLTGFSCGKWVNTPKKTAQHQALEHWVTGYLSGINMESAGVDFLQGRDIDGLTAWIDNYCSRNPLHAITQALFELVKELRSGR